tara:strand:- start:613 stop:1683 length:1071 start_codon:yes stop_codon:yes gene_type:complete
MKYVLITGSSGLVGSEAVKFFHNKKFKIIGIDNNFRKKFFGNTASVDWSKKYLQANFKNFKNYNIDISNYERLKKIFKKYKNKINLIINCAAQPSHDWAKKNIQLDFKINALGTLNLLDLVNRYCRTSPFIQLSTNKVYGDTPNRIKLYERPYRYDVRKSSKFYHGINDKMTIDNSVHSFFGVSKCSADLITQEYGRNLGLYTVVYRLGCITGPGHSGAELHGFLSYLVKCNIKKKKYKIFGYKGKQVRDNIHSNDLIKAIWEFYKKPKKGVIYNLGGGRENSCSVLEAIKLIEKESKIKFQYKILKKNRVGDHIWYISNNSKFKKDYKNWKIQKKLNLIIKEMVSSEFEKKNDNK